MRRMAWRQGLVEALYRKAIAPEQAGGTAAALALLEKAAAQVRLPDEGRPKREAARPTWDQPVAARARASGKGPSGNRSKREIGLSGNGPKREWA